MTMCKHHDGVRQDYCLKCAQEEIEQLRSQLAMLRMKDPEAIGFTEQLAFAQKEIAFLRGQVRDVDAEQARWQRRIHEIGKIGYHDASGNESGDPLDYTADCVRMEIDRLTEENETLKRATGTDRDALAAKELIGPIIDVLKARQHQLESALRKICEHKWEAEPGSIAASMVFIAHNALAESKEPQQRRRRTAIGPSVQEFKAAKPRAPDGHTLAPADGLATSHCEANAASHEVSQRPAFFRGRSRRVHT